MISVLVPLRTSFVPFYPDDLGLTSPSHYSIRSGVAHASYMTTLAFEELAARHPAVSFIHAYPGEIFTPEFARAEMPAWAKWLIWWVLRPVLTITGIALSYEEVGLRMLYLVVSSRFPPKQVTRGGGEHGHRLTKQDDGEEGNAMVGSDGEEGSGGYCVGASGERLTNDARLSRFRAQGVREMVWHHTMEVFDRVRTS